MASIEFEKENSWNLYIRSGERHLAGVLKRLTVLISGILLGFLLAGYASRCGWSLFPDRELSRSADYLKEVLRLVHENYVETEDATYARLRTEALHGMVEALDPHSEFLEAKEFAALDEELKGQFSGIGIQVESVEGRFVVVAPIAGTPGERAGIRRGDEILAVDGNKLSRRDSMDDVVQRLRGEPGTLVNLTLFRPSTAKEQRMEITREIIAVASVRNSQVLERGIGYLQLTEFSENTAEAFHQALDALLAKGIHSLIMDLRNNPGGLLEAAVVVAEPFFAQGERIVTVQGRRAKDREDFLSEIEGEPLRLAVAVLINAGSASAAEIVAGALKDGGKAVIVGERSFGKGSVQTVFPLRYSEGLRLTTARYLTPSGDRIHGRGVSPHIEVVMTPEEDEKLRLQKSREDLSDPEAFKLRFGFEPIVDRQLATAVDVLKAAELLRHR